MKKYILLFSLTFAAFFAVCFAGQAGKNAVAKVNVVDIVPKTVENSVICTGKVENTEDGKVYAPSASVLKKIYVAEGDKVQAGQKLMELSSTASQTRQASINSYEDARKAYSSYLSSSSASQAGDEEAVDSENSTETLTSPVSGTVTSISASQSGSYISPSKPAVVIQSGTGLQVRLSVNESQISDIRTGQKATITGTGFKHSVYSGTVRSIASDATQVTSVSGTETVIDVILAVDEAGTDIKPGFTAKAKIITSQISNVIVAPYETVMEDSSGEEYVYRIVGKKAVKTIVKTGEEFDDGFEIKSGIKANDKIVLDPGGVSDGEHVIPLTGKRVTA